MNYPLLFSGLLFSFFFLSVFASSRVYEEDDGNSCASDGSEQVYKVVKEVFNSKGNLEEQAEIPEPMKYYDTPSPPKIYKTLIQAAREVTDNTAAIKTLLASGANIEETDGIGRNCLYYALSWDFTKDYSNFFALLKGAGKNTSTLLDATFQMDEARVSVRQVAKKCMKSRPDLIEKMAKIEEDSLIKK